MLHKHINTRTLHRSWLTKSRKCNKPTLRECMRYDNNRKREKKENDFYVSNACTNTNTHSHKCKNTRGFRTKGEIYVLHKIYIKVETPLHISNHMWYNKNTWVCISCKEWEKGTHTHTTRILECAQHKHEKHAFWTYEYIDKVNSSQENCPHLSSFFSWISWFYDYFK